MVEDQDFDIGPALWDAGEGVCCAAFQLGACAHTEGGEGGYDSDPLTDQTPAQLDAEAATYGVPDDAGTPEFTDSDFVPTSEAEAIEAGGVLLATIGLADDGIYSQLVRVYVVDDQAAIYQAGVFVTSAPVAEIPRLLHRAVKVYNAGVGSF